MKRLRILPVLSLIAVLTPAAVHRPAMVLAAGPCSTSLTLTLHPGLPPSMKQGHLGSARDIPRAPVTVALPVYPGATPTTELLSKAVPDYPASPYLQTAVAVYTSTASTSRVKTWYRAAYHACGYRLGGSMETNASRLTSGITFQRGQGQDRTVEMSFGDTPSGGSYIAYAAEFITYPRRPARSYLHGPFIAVRITVRQSTLMNSGPEVSHTYQVAVMRRDQITHLVHAINALRDYHTVFGICMGGPGGGSSTGPAWLTFVRANGLEVHAFESGPGVCSEGLAVNGVRWVVDDGRVWNVLMHLAPPSSTQ